MSNSPKQIAEFVAPYRVNKGKRFRLANFDPDDTDGFGHELAIEPQERLHEGVMQLSNLQERLYAQDRWALLLIFQAMDAAGKDGTIKHVMSGINPQGCQVFSFKAPTSTELDHDYLWRCNQCLPERGRIGIFNRSYYEEVLVVRVKPELLAHQRLASERIGKRIWKQRFDDIRAYERYLDHNGVVVRKFFLNVSKEEQKKRFLSRLDEPNKNWKVALTDVADRKRWDDYMAAYEDMIRHTATKHAPWFVVPANNKGFARAVVVNAIIDALNELDLAFPKVDSKRRKELNAFRQALLREGNQR